MRWRVGDRLTHRFNPDLGPGMVRGIEGRTLVVQFPESDETLRIAGDSEALAPLVFRPGSRAVRLSNGEAVRVASVDADGRIRLEGGSVARPRELWPLSRDLDLSDRLAAGDVDPLEDFALRMDALHLAAVREADGLGSFLGGRIRLFPHQLHVALRATRSDPARWLLADEVGLGKTVEACLILNHLLRTRRADRTLVVAPDTLTVQWLGELWRKYHQVFVLLDDKRLEDVEREFGRGFNPFDAHRRVVVALEWLAERPRLAEQACAAGVDLLVVDEAHHLKRPPGHPGNPAYRAVRPLADLGRHVLLLTATPLEDDAHGFFRLLQLLRPEEFPEDVGFEARLARAEPLPPCTSATRREDVGGFPPRVPVAVAAGSPGDWDAAARLERELHAVAAPHAVARRAKLRLLAAAMASGAAVEPLLDPADGALRALAREAAEADPRVGWLAERAAVWKAAGDKTLVFVAQRETLEAIKTAMQRTALVRVGLFHEQLSAGQRDIEVAQFRLPAGPSLLLSTECGGEGRNFEFCTRLVLFDLPWNPTVVEQRIGRLDRIGRRDPVEIVYFVPPAGLGAAVAGLYESLGLFRRSLGGLERELADVEAAVEELALAGGGVFDERRLASLVEGAREGYDRLRSAAYRELHQEPYRPDLAAGLLGRVPEELESLTADVVLAASERLGLAVEAQRGEARYSIELGSGARVESLPGVPGGAAFLGTFDRVEAVEDEQIDFFASGHPLVEGLLEHLDESPLGRVALLDVHDEVDEPAFGLLALYPAKAGFEARAFDATGRERPELARRLARRPLRTRRVEPESWTSQADWAASIAALARHLPQRPRPLALAAFRVRPRPLRRGPRSRS